ncbi:phenylalanine--tRNA ligase subunit alpha [archaeon]|nr:phenylalanine--tRNA ligase subunit alpha [archaeon]
MNDLIKSLSPLEREVLPKVEDSITLKQLVKKTKKQEVEVMRALQWLQNKKVIEISLELKELVTLGELGKKYTKVRLPERRLLDQLKDKGKLTIKNIDLPKSELNIAIGELKKKAAIQMGKEITLSPNGRKLLTKDFIEEIFLSKLPKDLKEIENENKLAYNNLKKRKNIIETNLEKIRTIKLTLLGKKLIKQKLDLDLIEALTPAHIKKGTWKDKEFRRYDVKINVPNIYGGKRHFVKQATDYAKKIWLEMGFEEMTGPMLDSSFWVFDSLFTAQDHPVRDLQDTFYIANPRDAKLPKEFVSKVKKAHEKGTPGSTGWQYKWDENDAKRNVLRTHTTNLSARTIAQLDIKDLPKKYFALGRCYRNEALDWSHIFEFNQTEGIVIDENANFRHLLGYLKQFFTKMGFPKARFRPAHFPYTEPSVEIDVFHPVHKKWVELGGAGMFRPEVVIPILGKDVPVLAWGPGFDRIILEFYKINDIRELYKNDLKQLREIKNWIK